MRTAQGPTVYAYRFDWDDLAGLLWLDLPDLLGAAHGLEVPFVFGHMSFGFATRAVFGSEPREEDVALSRSMMSYWGQFARTGDPGRGRNGELPLWESWGTGPGDLKFLIFDAESDGGIRMSAGEVSRDAVIRSVATDPRHESAAERCSIYRALLEDGEIDAAELAALEGGACQPAPRPAAAD
jgi:para-nitrobenzyl esterase